MHCISTLWIGTAALLFMVVEYLVHRRETMAQIQVEVRNAELMEAVEGEYVGAQEKTFSRKG